jgi:hypothetical protein
MCSRSLGELPCDVLHHITELLVELHPKDSINIRRVNRELNYYHTNVCIKSYETEMCSMLSACRISVVSPKARLKYTLQYIHCIEAEGFVEENEENINEPASRINKRDMVFCVLLFFILFTL